MAAKKLTELQTKFLALLFDDNIKGNYRAAMKAAGYASGTPVAEVVASLRDEILERARDMLVVNACTSVNGLLDVAEDPTQLGGKVKLDALKEILDRAGLQKVDKSEVSVSGEGGIFILPAKEKA